MNSINLMTMKKKISVLMVDDHPMIIEGYQNTLLSIRDEDYELEVDTANDCEGGFNKIMRSAAATPYDVLFLDIKLPASKDGSITSGEDLAKQARKALPNAKIIVLTMHNENHRIHNILKSVDPDGFLIKSDLTSSELTKAFYSVMKNPPYYSNTVERFLRKTIQNDFTLDQVNRKIIFHLSQGIKTKNLPKFVGLSLSAIEKRKSNIKALFGIPSGDDEDILEEARKRGFI